MSTFFIICATIGGTILVLQLVLSLLGLGIDSLGGDFGGHLGDVGGHLGDSGGSLSLGDAGGHEGAGAWHGGDGGGNGHHESSHLGRLLTIQTAVAFLAFFGVGGLASLEAGRGAVLAVVIAMVTGLAAMLLVGVAFRSLGWLQSEGTVQIEQAVGLRGRVYLRIPAQGDGQGKLTLPIQGRTVEVRATTPGPELRTGSEAIVRKVFDDGTVEVVAASAEKPAPIPE